MDPGELIVLLLPCVSVGFVLMKVHQAGSRSGFAKGLDAGAETFMAMKRKELSLTTAFHAKEASVAKEAAKVAGIELKTVERSLARKKSDLEAIEKRVKAEFQQVYANATLLSNGLIATGNLERHRAESASALALAESRLMVLENDTDRIRREKEDVLVRLSALDDDAHSSWTRAYRKNWDFGHAHEYQERISAIQAEARSRIRSGSPASVVRLLPVGSPREADRIAKSASRLLAIAFVDEADGIIADATWSNIVSSVGKIGRSASRLNTLALPLGVALDEATVSSKVDELTLVHEHRIRKRDEQEEQRYLRERMRDEEKARREAEKALEEVESEQSGFEAALERAKTEIVRASDEKRGELEARIRTIQSELDELNARRRRMSLAEQTRAGYVYVVSNVGSFGEGVYKIGLTRRLDPQERIDELGGASVPFPFDVHAFIWSENAPGLEADLHARFRERRVNLVNPRKEFFRVDLETLMEVSKELRLEMDITLAAEARQWRESEMLRLEPLLHPVATLPSEVSRVDSIRPDDENSVSGRSPSSEGTHS